MNEEKIFNSLKNRISREKLEKWTNTLKGFHPLKKNEMLEKFSDRLNVLIEINNFIEEFVKEFDSSSELIGEQIRRLQKEYNLGVNFNAVKHTALRQMIKYSATEEKEIAPKVRKPERQEERDLAGYSRSLKEELKEIAEALKLKQVEEYPISGGRVDVVWIKKTEGSRDIPVVGFEIETSWRTRKHIKGDIFNLSLLKPILGIILFIKKGFGNEKEYSGNLKAAEKYVREWKEHYAIIVLNEEQIRVFNKIIV